MVRFIILSILATFVLRAFLRFWGGLKEGLRGESGVRGRSGVPQLGVQMARDPVCGTFVVPERAIALTSGRDQQYFCSAGCRDKYQAQRAHPA